MSRPLRTSVLLGILLGALLAAAPLAAQAPDRTQDPDAEVRTLAYRQLGDRQDPGSLELLALRLSQESDPGARVAATDAIGRLLLGPAELEAALTTSPSPHARAWAAHALGNYPGLGSVQVLMTAAADPDERVRREVYEGLGRLGDPLAVDTLTKAAVRDPSVELRRVADRAAHQVVSGRRARIDVPTELAVLAAGDADARAAAARNLGASGDWRVYQPLLHAATSGPTTVRVAAISGLGALGDRRAVPMLHGLVRTADGTLRYHAIAALAHLGDESSRPLLISLLQDPDVDTRRFAVRALGWIGGEEVLQALGPVLEDPERAVRSEVVQQLRDLDGASKLGVVMRATADPDPVLRAEAARLLSAQSGPDVVPTLLALLDDGDALVRLTATDGLVAHGAVQAVPRLRALEKSARSDDERQLYTLALKQLAAPG